MPLDPQVQAMRERALAAGTPPLYTLSIEEARAADLAAIPAAAGTGFFAMSSVLNAAHRARAEVASYLRGRLAVG